MNLLSGFPGPVQSCQKKRCMQEAWMRQRSMHAVGIQASVFRLALEEVHRSTHMNESLLRSTRLVYNTFVSVNNLNSDRDLSGSFIEITSNGLLGIVPPNARSHSPGSAPESPERGGVPVDLGLASSSE